MLTKIMLIGSAGPRSALAFGCFDRCERVELFVLGWTCCQAFSQHLVLASREGRRNGSKACSVSRSEKDHDSDRIESHMLRIHST